MGLEAIFILDHSKLDILVRFFNCKVIIIPRLKTTNKSTFVSSPFTNLLIWEPRLRLPQDWIEHWTLIHIVTERCPQP